MKNIRNVAIIAHVDHGKTTLVDALLKQSRTHLNKEMAATECIMDSNAIERERGITIFSKNASVQWGDVKINIIDTPGHADFGGEVERVLKMADGCLLLVDAKEGPMPQTRFVLKQALATKHKIIVVINKVDRADARPDMVLDKTFDLFFELGADDETADFPVVYTSAKQGVAGTDSQLAKMTDITPVFDAIVNHIPSPSGDETKSLQMLVTTTSPDNYKGVIATGRVMNGVLRAGQEVMHIARDGNIKRCRLISLMTFQGLERVEADEVRAGDILAVAGIPDVMAGETVADPEQPEALPLLDIEKPTVKMTFSVNDSPVAGQEGEFTTSRQIRARLYKELETDMALRVEDGENSNLSASAQAGWVVSGRGELHLAIFIERLRREGYEFQVSRPKVIEKEIGGVMTVPYEQAFIEVPENYSGVVIQKLGSRNGILHKMKVDDTIAHLEFIIPTRGLFGYRTEFLTDTRGTGIMNTIFYKYQPDAANWNERDHGSLVAHETGVTALYGLLNVQDRGVLFFAPGVPVYKGQVVGEHSRDNDLRVNVCKTKHLTNMRSKGEGTDEHFNAPRTMDLEDALEYIGDDELVEVTPKNVRIRKKILDTAEHRRKLIGLKT